MSGNVRSPDNGELGIEVVSERGCMFPSSAMAGGVAERENGGVKAGDGGNQGKLTKLTEHGHGCIKESDD